MNALRNPTRPVLAAAIHTAAICASLVAVTSAGEAHAANYQDVRTGVAAQSSADLHQRLAAERNQVAQRLEQLLEVVVARSTLRMDEYREAFGLAATFRHGLGTLTAFDGSSDDGSSDAAPTDWDVDAEEDTAEPAREAPRSSGREDRFEYVTDTNDPLAGI